MKYLIIYDDSRVYDASLYNPGSVTALATDKYAMTCTLDQARIALAALGVDYSFLDTVSE